MKKFEDIIEKDGKLIFTNVGRSMWPLIRQDKDLMVIEKAKGRLNKYDIPLYKRKDGKYILHRILKVREKDYVICGDNLAFREYGITDENIIGVLTKVIRNGKELKLTSFKCKIYTHIWCDMFPVRYLIIRSRDLLKRVIRKMQNET